MKFVSYYLLTVLASTASRAQIASDFTTYWVNDKYMACVDSGNSICKCQSQNSILILYVDTVANKLILDPSVYVSWEPIELSYKRTNKQKSEFALSRVPHFDKASTFIIKDNKLTLTAEQTTVFTKIRVRPIDNGQNWGDLWKQIGALGCRPLLKYSRKLCGDSCAFPLTPRVLADNISKGQVTISCSDDYHYDEMYFHSSQTNFFLIYKGNTIEAYRQAHPRIRGEKVDVSKLKDCQLFYRE